MCLCVTIWNSFLYFVVIVSNMYMSPMMRFACIDQTMKYIDRNAMMSEITEKKLIENKYDPKI